MYVYVAVKTAIVRNEHRPYLHQTTAGWRVPEGCSVMFVARFVEKSAEPKPIAPNVHVWDIKVLVLATGTGTAAVKHVFLIYNTYF